ncbi:hypothetical protein [Mesorhizobium sp. IMUNJ 23232]|uniref:hypothetical protein n=1 Tax=Mesorhizobium sp. IMUNJ 23232 TaxID=3376064 RepID=UPI0037A649BE
MRERKQIALVSSGANGPAEGGCGEIDEATSNAIDLYGSNAMTAVAWRALNAHFDGNAQEYQFWCKVFGRLSLFAQAGLQT